MTREEMETWATERAREIVLDEGQSLSVAARDMDMEALEASSNELATAIVRAILEAYDEGASEE